MIATVSPRRTPSCARPPATASTRPRSSPQVSETLSSALRTATTSRWLAAVRRNASATVCASTARSPTGVIVLLSIVPPLCRALSSAPRKLSQCGLKAGSRRNSADVEAWAAERRDVVAEADHEQHHDQHEADHPGPLHHLERDPPTPDLLGHGPEHVPAVQRQEREQVDDAQRQRDQREDLERLRGA